MRVMTWNVRSLRDDADGVGRVIRSAAPDVVLVQEAPRLWRWRSANARLARQAGLVVVTGGRPAAGNLLLCSLRVRVVSSREVLLPKRPGLHRRGYVSAVLEVDRRQLRVLGTHLDLDADARLDSVMRIREQAYDLIGADVNEEPGRPAWTALSAGLVDVGDGLGPTFSVANPRRRIDGLFVAPGLRVVRAEVLDCGPVSDHRPVLAELAWTHTD
ncbi:MAG: endonuclease/exonuclease/phosphatase family protein [Actinobacteria bacterium]|nr:endonuclease/exonuclease/phosphatase family protein [Actinomycetota bacterium]MCA1719596.1 endonuclease/exonuclease/phosphatase family protein [Actinomycetota bacterium]